MYCEGVSEPNIGANLQSKSLIKRIWKNENLSLTEGAIKPIDSQKKVGADVFFGPLKHKLDFMLFVNRP